MEKEILNILQNKSDIEIISYFISITEKKFINNQEKNQVIFEKINFNQKYYFLELIDYNMDFIIKSPERKDYTWIIQHIKDPVVMKKIISRGVNPSVLNYFSIFISRNYCDEIVEHLFKVDVIIHSRLLIYLDIFPDTRYMEIFYIFGFYDFFRCYCFLHDKFTEPLNRKKVKNLKFPQDILSILEKFVNI